MSRVAVVHPTTLVGKELRERLENRPDLASEILLLAVDDSEVGAVTDNLGAAAFVARAEPGSLDDAELTFFCGSIEHDREALRLLPSGARAVLLSRGVTVEDAPPAIAGLTELSGLPARVASPHPVAVALATLLAPLRRHRLRRAEATAVLPVSAAADEAIEELFEQTRALLSFSGGSSERFGGQIAFNLLPSSISPDPLLDAVVAALGAEAPRPALQLLQGGIFHGVAISLFVEVAEDPGAEALRAALASGAGVEAADDPAALGPVTAATDQNLLVGDVRAAGIEGGYWAWAVMDNLGRGAAANAIALAEALIVAPPIS